MLSSFLLFRCFLFVVDVVECVLEEASEFVWFVTSVFQMLEEFIDVVVSHIFITVQVVEAVELSVNKAFQC